jgi:hypothetical protein
MEPCVWIALKAIRVDDLHDAAPKSGDTLGIRSDGRICGRPTAAATTFQGIRECSKQIANENV